MNVCKVLINHYQLDFKVWAALVETTGEMQVCVEYTSIYVAKKSCELERMKDSCWGILTLLNSPAQRLNWFTGMTVVLMY